MRTRPRFFVDDKFSIVEPTSAEVWRQRIQTEVFLAEQCPRKPYLTHMGSFEGFVMVRQLCDWGIVRRCDPAERPAWSREFLQWRDKVNYVRNQIGPHPC